MKLGTLVGLGPGHIMLAGDQLPLPKGHSSLLFGPYLLWPNGWMDQDATWYTEVGIGPGDIVLDGANSPPPKRGTPPIFSPCLLWPNGRQSQLLAAELLLFSLMRCGMNFSVRFAIIDLERETEKYS